MAQRFPTRSRVPDINSLEVSTEKLKVLILKESTFVLLSEILNDIRHTDLQESIGEKIIKFSVDRLDDQKTSELLDILSPEKPPLLPRGILSPSSSSGQGGARRKTRAPHDPERHCLFPDQDSRSLRHWRSRVSVNPEFAYLSEIQEEENYNVEERSTW